MVKSGEPLQEFQCMVSIKYKEFRRFGIWHRLLEKIGAETPPFSVKYIWESWDSLRWSFQKNIKMKRKERKKNKVSFLTGEEDSD